MTIKQVFVKKTLWGIIGAILFYQAQKYFFFLLIIFMEKMELSKIFSEVPKLIWLSLGVIGFVICFKLLTTTWKQVSENEPMFSSKTIRVWLYIVLLGINTLFIKLGILIPSPR